MKAKLVRENIRFERGKDPKYAMGLGLAEEIANSTSDAFSFERYGKDLWTKIIQWLLDGGYNPEQIDVILRSKYMRWGYDHMSDYKKIPSLEDFDDYFSDAEDDIQAMIEDELGPPELSEDMGGAMGGVSAPMATLTNTPGVGNVVPGAGPDGIGSGDNFDSSSGPFTQDGKKKKKKKPVNEMNINPHDPVGVAMAKKLGAALPFEKGKGDQDVRQKRIDKDIDLDTDKDGMMSIEEWQKKFLGNKK